MDEQRLIEAALKGDLEAFNQLILAYQDLVFNQALWLLKDAAAAEDFAQDSFLQAYKKLDQFRGGSFRGWLMRIVTNACYDELRRQKRRPTLPLTAEDEDGLETDTEEWLVSPGASVEELVEQAELSAALQSTLDELPGEYSEVVRLVDLLELDYKEVAEMLSIPVGTVKSRLARGRLRLRQRLEANLDRLMSGEFWGSFTTSELSG
jgi:RNA polymerase sigma-70 factor, ECF subfamily